MSIEFYRDFTGLNRDVIAGYAHLEVDARVRPPSSVRRGQVLGKLVPYPGHGVHHLHIEFQMDRKIDRKIIDPLRVFLGDLETPVEELSSKDVKIPYLTNKGNLHPPNSRIIWPLTCKE